jgi:serine/threonine protein phosphatase PrpC
MIPIEQSKQEWQFIGNSVRGASHIRNNKPNQDAIAWLPCLPTQNKEHERDGPDQVVKAMPLIVAIADGHGSERHIHSDRGARFAVDTAVSVLEKFIHEHDGDSPTSIKRIAQQLLPNLLVRNWKEQVNRDLEALKTIDTSITASDTTEDNINNSQPQISDRYIEYGTTLLAVAVTDSYILYVQLGDGDILTVLPTGEVTRPLPTDANLIANETYSLCEPQAQDNFRIRLQMLEDISVEKIPLLIMLSTDGYSNSYKTDDDFFAVAKDYTEMAQKYGLKQIGEHLETWLNEVSEGASGDDITLAILMRTGAKLLTNTNVTNADELNVAKQIPTTNEDSSGKEEKYEIRRLIFFQQLLIALLLFEVVVTVVAYFMVYKFTQNIEKKFEVIQHALNESKPANELTNSKFKKPQQFPIVSGTPPGSTPKYGATDSETPSIIFSEKKQVNQSLGQEHKAIQSVEAGINWADGEQKHEAVPIKNLPSLQNNDTGEPNKNGIKNLRQSDNKK